MGIIIRQSLHNSVYTYLGIILGFVNIIWLYPFILESGEFGLTRLLISLSVVTAQFAHLGMGNVTIRFFPKFRDPELRHFGFLFLALFIPLFGFLICAALFLLFQSEILRFYDDGTGLFEEYFILFFPMLFFVLYFNVLDYYARALYNTIASSFIKEVLLRLFNLAAVLIYFFGWVNFTGFMILFVLGYALQTLLLLLYIAYIGQLFVKPDFSKLDRAMVDSMIRYSLYALLSGMTVIALSNIDIMMLGGLAGLSETAIYTVAFYVAAVITVPARSILKIAHPMVASALAKNDLEYVYDIYRKSSINQLLLGALIFTGVWANIHHLMSFLPEEYEGGRYVILIIGLAKLFDMATGVNSGIILNSKYFRFDLVVTVLLLVMTVGFNLIFIPLYGITGAALATALSLVLYNSIKYYFIYLKFDMQPFSIKTAGAVFTALAALLLTSLIPEIRYFLIDLAVRSVVIIGIFGIMTYRFRLSPDLIMSVMQLIKTRSL